MANPLEQVASWPATAAAGFASATGLMEKAGPTDQPFRWASVTKLLVALAALDGVQRGLLDLDEPAGPPGSTIRHLLAHASGLAFDSDAILGRPGARRIYSNRGIEIVAVEGEPRRVRQQVPDRRSRRPGRLVQVEQTALHGVERGQRDQQLGHRGPAERLGGGPGRFHQARGRRDADRGGGRPGCDLIKWICHRPRVNA